MSRRALAIINAAAPRLKPAILSGLHQALGARNFYLTASAAEAHEVLETAMTGEPLAVIVGGGDGTVTAALTATAQLAAARSIAMPAFALLPLGTGNAFTAYAAAEPIEALVAAARGDRLRRWLDTVAARERVGLFCGFGVDAQIIEDHAAVAMHLPGLGRGRLGYALSLATRSLPGFVRRRRPIVRAINRGAPAIPLDRAGPLRRPPIDPGAELWSGRLTLAACATITGFGFGLQMFAHGDRRDGRFQIRLSDAGLLEILANTGAAFRGQYFTDRTHDFWCDAVDLELDTPAPFEIGGELVGRFDRVRVELGPRLSLI